MKALVLDTQALIVSSFKGKRLRKATQSAVCAPDAAIYLPTIAIAEFIYYGLRIGQVDRIQAVIDRAVESLNATVVPLTADILRWLPLQLEMHDAIVVATALWLREQGREAAVVTGDEQITACGLITVIW